MRSVPRTRGDIEILRAFSRAFHMIDDPNDLVEEPCDRCGPPALLGDAEEP